MTAATDIQAALDELAQLRARLEALEANATDTNLAERVRQNETAIPTLEHNFPSYAGFVAGLRNTIAGPYATVSPAAPPPPENPGSG